MSTEFYILDIVTSRRMDFALWWGEKNAGYTTSLALAGRYSTEQVQERKSYYDNRIETWAFECDVIDRLAQRVVPCNSIRVLTGGE